jgi:hypothetical protein
VDEEGMDKKMMKKGKVDGEIMKAPGLVKIAAPKEGSVRKGAIASVTVGQKSTRKYAEMDPQEKNKPSK